jgi:hypothetical protein
MDLDNVLAQASEYFGGEGTTTKAEGGADQLYCACGPRFLQFDIEFRRRRNPTSKKLSMPV